MIDPNKLLRSARELVEQILNQDDPDNLDADRLLDRATDLASEFKALDEWLSEGRALPHVWAEQYAETESEDSPEVL